MSPYTSLNVSPGKKRVCSNPDEESTPKRRRIASPIPRPIHKPPPSFPAHLSRLNYIHSTLQRALSHAVAGCTIGTSEGKIPNVLNLISIKDYIGFNTITFTEGDLERICWIWEWDTASVPPSATSPETEDDSNPFLVSTASSPSKGSKWTRGSMGCIVSAATHPSKPGSTRVPVYGIGIQVGSDGDKDKICDMVAVARWAANVENRVAEFQSKLEAWINLHADTTGTPNVPLAKLPSLTGKNAQPSALTRAFASSSPEGATIIRNMSTGPSSSFKSTSSSDAPLPVPLQMAKARSSALSPSKPRTSESVPSTPSSRLNRAHPLEGLLTPKARKRIEGGGPDLLPMTPIRQRGSDAQTTPSARSTSRRQALYDRVRLKSLTSTPVKSKSSEVRGGGLTSEQLQKLGDAGIQRRYLLGRLDKIAKIIQDLFSSKDRSTATLMTGARRRKALPTEVVAGAVKGSILFPISKEDIMAALKLLTEICPFFLKERVIGGEDWLEMPATRAVPTSSTTESSSRTTYDTRSLTKSAAPLLSPRSQIRSDDSMQLSPLCVSGQHIGGINDVQAKIKYELGLYSNL